MKNITVSVPDEVYRAVRIKAAEHDTTVSAIVRRHLEAYSRPENNRDANRDAKRQLMELIEQFRRDHPDFSASERLSREELYDRDARRREFEAQLGLEAHKE